MIIVRSRWLAAAFASASTWASVKNLIGCLGLLVLVLPKSVVGGGSVTNWSLAVWLMPQDHLLLISCILRSIGGAPRCVSDVARAPSPSAALPDPVIDLVSARLIRVHVRDELYRLLKALALPLLCAGHGWRVSGAPACAFSGPSSGP